MRKSAVSGLIFANSDDSKLKKLTENRSMGSVPFGARYRVIDFALSNLVNAGVNSVGIVTKENYRSLMDHVGSGISWDLDRKNGGLYLIPPYYKKGVKRYTGTISALYAAIDFIERCGSKYMVLCDSHVIANIDIQAALEKHKENDADITIIYCDDELPQETYEKMIVKLDDDQKVTEMSFDSDKGKVLFGIGVTIINRELLIKLINQAVEDDLANFTRDVIANNLKTLKVYGFEHKEFIAIMDNSHTYYQASMALLERDVRKQLFNPERPIYTKVRDSMPTRYGTKSSVTNCLIGDDCVIDGTVKNSIIFRGVKVQKGAVVENCILMQETFVGEGAQLDNVITDKNAVIGERMILKGTVERHSFIKKNQVL